MNWVKAQFAALTGFVIILPIPIAAVPILMPLLAIDWLIDKRVYCGLLLLLPVSEPNFVYLFLKPFPTILYFTGFFVTILWSSLVGSWGLEKALRVKSPGLLDNIRGSG